MQWSTTIAFFSVLLVPLYAARNDWYNTDKSPFRKSCKAWMSHLPNSTPLSAIAIPGTHDTMSRYGGDLVRTQAQELKDQLEAGIRALDIRLRHISNVFTIHHGRVYQRANFGEVLNICNDFLEKHPTEVVVMFLQKEHTEEKVTRSFEQTFLWYRDQTKNGRLIWKGTHIPKLSEVRGKIVIIDGMPGSKVRGISEHRVDMQNDWTVPTLFHIGKKIKKVKAHMDKHKNRDTLYANWLNGVSGGAYPYSVAKRVNPAVYKYIDRTARKKDSCRIVMMDFPGEGLIRKILHLNFDQMDKCNA